MLIQKDGCAKQVMQMLRLAFSQEKVQWKPWKYSETGNMEKDAEVSGLQRDAVVKWLSGLNDFLRFTPETVFVAASMLDSFLHSVRAHPKYLYCIAISCFYIAIKINEEDEVIPTIQELLDICHCGCSVAELVRMERVILRKMDWNLKRVTALDFLHIFHGLLVLNCPGLLGMNQVGAGSFLVWLGVKLKALLPFFKLAIFRPSAIALSLISLELQSISHNWFAFTIALQKLAEISNCDVIECRKELSQIMFHLYGQNRIYSLSCKKTTYFPLNPVKRKMEQTDVEDIYDSIKRLYGEDGATHCSTAAVQDSATSLSDHHQLTSVAAI